MIPEMCVSGIAIPNDVVSPLQHPALGDASSEWAQAILAKRKMLFLRGPTITQTLERAMSANPPNEAGRMRYYFRRLSEIIGDLPIE